MTLDEAISHAEDVANKQNEIAFELNTTYNAVTEYSKECSKRAEDHRQLAERLKELNQLREQTRWIPVSERLPGDSGTYLVTVHDGRKKRTTFAQYQKKLKKLGYDGSKSVLACKSMDVVT